VPRHAESGKTVQENITKLRAGHPLRIKAKNVEAKKTKAERGDKGANLDKREARGTRYERAEEGGEALILCS